jgi:hypothetical protein
MRFLQAEVAMQWRNSNAMLINHHTDKRTAAQGTGRSASKPTNVLALTLFDYKKRQEK